ncbi:MAG: hypothetical protein K6E89_01400 [Sphaerochaetaceae bacterium]|nr:hypothetical protein [Sphaerochaetaceae bacterium]
MKKWLVVFFSALWLFALPASDFLGEFSKRESYIPDHIVLSTGNDLFNFGISRNDDDQLSYSFDFQLEAPLWYIRFNANGITNRGWRDGWDMRNYDAIYTPGALVIRGRYDSLETVIGLKLKPVEDNFYLHIYPEIGFALVGDYGWEWGQNAIHKMMNIHEVDLPYDSKDQRDVFMMLDLRVNVGFKFHSFERTNLIGEIEASTKNIVGFQSENQILARISVSTETHDLVGFHVGYMYAASLQENTRYTQDLYIRYLNGLKVGFIIDTGIIFLKYTGNPQTNYGYGYIGFDVMGFFSKRKWERSDIYMRLANARFYDRSYHIIGLGIPLADSLDLVIKNSYLGGDPISPKEEAVEDLYKYERFKRDYSFFTFGARYTFPEFAWGYVRPYVELTAGLQRFRMYMLSNQVDDDYMFFINTPSTNLSRVLEFDEYFGLLNLECGITVLPENLVVFEHTSFQIELFGGMNLIVGGNTQEISVYRNIQKFWEEFDAKYLEDMGWKARFIPYYGFAAKLGFDL